MQELLHPHFYINRPKSSCRPTDVDLEIPRVPLWLGNMNIVHPKRMSCNHCSRSDTLCIKESRNLPGEYLPLCPSLPSVHSES